MTAPVTIIIVNYNKRPYSQLCLESILQGDPLPAQIVCIDNGSTDGTQEYLADEFPSLTQQAGVEYQFIANEGNAGAITARNQGLEVATQPYIAFCDNDLVMRSRDWLATLLGVLEEDEMNGIVGAKLVFPFEPYNIECAGVRISPTGRVQYRGRGESIDAPEFNERCEVQCLISACWVMRKAITDAIGGMDEIFNPAQFEDFDLCYRARENGWRVLYEPRAEMYHFENTTTDGSVDVKFKYVTMKNWQAFKERWRHMFETEGGPPDSECRWAKLETRPLERTGVPPII